MGRILRSMRTLRVLPMALLALLAACEPQYPQPQSAVAVDSLGRPIPGAVVPRGGGGFLGQHGDALIAGAAGYMMGKSAGQSSGSAFRQPVYVAPRTVYRSYSAPTYRPSYRSYSKPSFSSFRGGRR